LVATANGNAFVNDAAKNLNLKPWYDGSEIPTGQTLIHHIRKSSREEITRMFMKANEPLFEIADDYDYFPDKAEVAIDITDWPYFGDPDADEYVRGTKSGRNYARAWKYITLSLVGTDTPLVLLVLPVRKRSEAPQYVRRLLRLASQYLDLHRVYLDAGTEFYSEDTIHGQRVRPGASDAGPKGRLRHQAPPERHGAAGYRLVVLPLRRRRPRRGRLLRGGNQVGEEVLTSEIAAR